MKGRALIFLALSSSFASASVFSTFDFDNEGWSAVNVSPVDLSILETHAAGWSGERLVESESSFTMPGLFVLSAPSKFLGDQSEYYDAVATFQLSDAQIDGTAYPSLLLRGNGIAIGFTAGQLPTPAGELFSVPLFETGWVKFGGGAVTKAEFQSVLSNLDVFAINADWRLGGTDDVTLDNVALLTPVPEPATWAALGLGVAGLMRRRKVQRPISK